MSSSKEEGTATAPEQLGSMSIGESAERTDNDDAEPNTKNGSTPTKKLCSACDEESKTLKMCNGCRCVWYCNKKCQNKHRKEHKHECRRIKKELDRRGGKLDLGKELDIGPLGEAPSREECPICMRILPFHASLHTYAACCGKTLCGSCNLQHARKSEERVRTCAFCRTAAPYSDEELLTRIRKRIKRKDPIALNSLAVYHGYGQYGLPVDQAKCIDLLRQSAGLGCPSALYQLGLYYHQSAMGLAKNEKETRKHYEKAAEGGHLIARHNLGCVEARNSDGVAAMCHFRLSASAGYKPSMEALLDFYEDGLLHYGDLAEALPKFYRVKTEMKSGERHVFIEYLKAKGEYQKEYEL